MVTRNFASKFDSGSSKRNTFGCLTIALPTATRCLWPPESALGFLASNSSMSRILAASFTRFAISSLENFLIFSPKAMLS